MVRVYAAVGRIGKIKRVFGRFDQLVTGRGGRLVERGFCAWRVRLTAWNDRVRKPRARGRDLSMIAAKRKAGDPSANRDLRAARIEDDIDRVWVRRPIFWVGAVEIVGQPRLNVVVIDVGGSGFSRPSNPSPSGDGRSVRVDRKVEWVVQASSNHGSDLRQVRAVGYLRQLLRR